MKECKFSVIQANENAGEWCGCILIVKESHDWGVQAGMKIPYKGVTFVRLNHDQYELIGGAKLFFKDEDSEDS